MVKIFIHPDVEVMVYQKNHLPLFRLDSLVLQERLELFYRRCLMEISVELT